MRMREHHLNSLLPHTGQSSSPQHQHPPPHTRHVHPPPHNPLQHQHPPPHTSSSHTSSPLHQHPPPPHASSSPYIFSPTPASSSPYIILTIHPPPHTSFLHAFSYNFTTIIIIFIIVPSDSNWSLIFVLIYVAPLVNDG